MEMCRTQNKQGSENTGKDEENGMFLGGARDKMRSQVEGEKNTLKTL